MPGTKKKAGRRSGELGVNHKVEIGRFKKICVTVAKLRNDVSRKSWHDEGLNAARNDCLKRKEAGTEDTNDQPKAVAPVTAADANVGINFDNWTGEKLLFEADVCKGNCCNGKRHNIKISSN